MRRVQSITSIQRGISPLLVNDTTSAFFFFFKNLSLILVLELVETRRLYLKNFRFSLLVWMAVNDRNDNEQEDGKMEEGKKATVYMWGYLPGVSPEKSPILNPISVNYPDADDSWKDVCGGGCGFAMAISG